MPVGDKDFPWRRALLRIGFGPDRGVAQLEFRRIAPGAGQVATDRGDFAAAFMHLQHTSFHQVEMVKKVEILMEQRMTGQVDAIQRTITAALQRGHPLVGSVMNGEMGCDLL